MPLEINRDHDGPVAGSDRVELQLPPREGRDLELPLRVLVMGDFLQRPDPRPLAERPAIGVDGTSFSEVMAQQQLTLAFEVPNRLDEAAREPLAVSLRFRRLSDMAPKAVAQQVPRLKALLDLRGALTALKGRLRNEKAFRDKIQDLVANPDTRAPLAAYCGVSWDEATVAAAHNERAVARDEAELTRDPARLAQLAHGHPVVRRAVAANEAIDDATVWELVCRGHPEALRANRSVFARLEASPAEWGSRGIRLLPAMVLHFAWSDALACYLVDKGGDDLHLYLAMEMPLEAGEDGPARPRCGMDRFARVHAWCGSSMYFSPGHCQRPASELDELLSRLEGDGVVAKLRNVAALCPWLWRAVCQHPDCPRDVLERLAHAPQELVRVAVLGHPATPRAVVEHLLADANDAVREASHVRARVPLASYGNWTDAADPSLVTKALEAFAKASLPLPAPGAFEPDPRWPQRLFKRREPRVAWLGRDPVGPTELRALWETARWNRQHILGHIECPLDVLESANDTESFDGLFVAIHPNASDALLERLLHHWRPYTRAAARAQRALPPHQCRLPAP